jgi:type IV pilus assembly protein PilC
MPVYVYKGRQLRSHSVVLGERFAADTQALAAILRKEQIAPIFIREKKEKLKFSGFSMQRVSVKELALFSRQFAIMLDAGLPLVQCLEILGNQTPNKVFKKILLQILNDVESGSTLSDAMRKHPKAFDELYTNMIAAGEAGGILDSILKRLTVFSEKIVKLRRAIVSASMYPSIVLSVAAAVIVIILYFAIPIFKTLFEGLDAPLPFVTRFVIGLSNMLKSYILFILGAVGVAIFGVRSYYHTDQGRKAIDGLMLRLPILGDVFRKIAVARFSRTLSTLLTSGVSIIEALEITARTAGNSVVQEAILSTRKAIEEGRTLSEPLKATGIFPSMVTQMVSVGEQTGELDTMLSKVADYFEEEVDATVASMMTIMEPVLMVFLGVVIGGIVISMYLPIFTLIGKLSANV